jgi:hypothetical protein
VGLFAGDTSRKTTALLQALGNQEIHFSDREAAGLFKPKSKGRRRSLIRDQFCF